MIEKWKFIMLYSNTRKDLNNQPYTLFLNNEKIRFRMKQFLITPLSLLLYFLSMRYFSPIIEKYQNFAIQVLLIILYTFIYYVAFSLMLIMFLPIKKK